MSKFWQAGQAPPPLTNTEGIDWPKCDRIAINYLAPLIGTKLLQAFETSVSAVEGYRALLKIEEMARARGALVCIWGPILDRLKFEKLQALEEAEQYMIQSQTAYKAQ